MASRWIQTEGTVIINRNHISSVYIRDRRRADGYIYTVTARITFEEHSLKSFLDREEAKAWIKEMFKPRTKEDKV